MAALGEFDDKAIQAFFKNFKKNSENADVKAILEKHLTKVGNIVVTETKARTSVGKINGGTLRRGWKKTVRVGSGSVEVEIFNNVDYASFVENGHRIVRNGVTYGYVEGKKMLASTVDDAGALLDKVANDAMEEITSKLFGGH